MVITFYILANLALAGGLGVVFTKNPVASAMSLVLTFLALAGIYLTLDAQFLAAVQVLVYAGAIMVLFIFVILLVDQDRIFSRGFSLIRLPVPVLVIALSVAWAFLLMEIDLPTAVAVTDGAGTGQATGQALFTRYVFPFETASIILLAAMIGAVVISKKKGVK
jgi:NADH-quinone oxidoreductase subunit J